MRRRAGCTNARCSCASISATAAASETPRRISAWSRVLQKQFADARDWFEKSMALNREVGDAWMVALCDHNLANANRELGDLVRAREHYAASLRAYRGYDDPWAVGFLLEDVAVLLATIDDVAPAYELLGAADALRDANAMPRAPSRAREIEQSINDLATSLPQYRREACRSKGREMVASSALDYALRRCAATPPSEA